MFYVSCQELICQMHSESQAAESAWIFSSYLLVGQFFSLKSLSSLNTISTTKRLPESPRAVFLVLQVRPFFYCDLDLFFPCSTPHPWLWLRKNTLCPCHPAHFQERCVPWLEELILPHLLWGKTEGIRCLNSSSKGMVIFCTCKTNKKFLRKPQLCPCRQNFTFPDSFSSFPPFLKDCFIESSPQVSCGDWIFMA